MKKINKNALKHSDTGLETDIDDSSPLCFLYKSPAVPIQNKKRCKGRPAIQPQIPYKKLLRFQLKHLRQTLRVPCYNEESLNMPIRFTRKLNVLEVDNDVDTDQEIVEDEIDRCCGWLKSAIQAQKTSSQSND